MKISKKRLEQIINEEVERSLGETFELGNEEQEQVNEEDGMDEDLIAQADKLLQETK